MSTAAAAAKRPIHSRIPARPDRLKWPPFHTRTMFVLGAARIPDGLQTTPPAVEIRRSTETRGRELL